MVFSDSTNKQGIVEEIDFLINTDFTTYPLTHKTRNINRWYDKTIGWVVEATNPSFEFDDSKYTTLPVFTTNLVSGQFQYAMDSTWFDVFRIDVKDANGYWRQLTNTDQSVITGGYDQYQTTNSTPLEFDIIANVIELHPAPNYSSTGGMKVWANRKGSYFATTGTDSQEPGFAPQFHRILSLGAAFDYAISRQLPQASALRQEIEQMHKEIDEWYGERGGVKLRITPKRYGYNPAR
jgi:hypothetical protein